MMPNPEKADVSGEEYEKMFKGYFHRLALQRYLARAVATSQLWNLLMSVYSDDPQDDYWNLLQDANKKKQPNIALNYNISPLLADIFPQYAGARMYLNLIGHFNDPVRAATQTVNFAVGKKSLVAKAALELSTGEDWRGQKYKPIDDYITSVFDVFRDNLWDGLKDVSLTADYGEYVPYYDSSLQTPTVLLGQLQGILPIPVQALIGISLGEGDALDFTQRISQATGVRVIATPAEQNLKRRQRFYAELWREGKITPEQEKRWKEISRELGEIQRRKEEMKKWDEEPFWMEGL
jgi:hypothetical protein